jgi:hypothetical protein
MARMDRPLAMMSVIPAAASRFGKDPKMIAPESTAYTVKA